MSLSIPSYRFSVPVFRRRLWWLVSAAMPKRAAKSDARAQVKRLQTLASDLGLTEPIVIVDIGANPLDYDAPYKPLLDAGLCRVVGFEPQADALARLETQKSAAETYIGEAVGDGHDHTFYSYEHSGLSSLFQVDDRSASFIKYLGNLSTPTGSGHISTRRLDDMDSIPSIDFLKIDIQGGELAVLTNAHKKLANAVAVQIEMRFLPIYRDEPRMGDVDLELTGQGFEIHTAVPFVGMRIANSQNRYLKICASAQILDGDFMYVRALRTLEKLPAEHLKKLAILADGVFNSVDLTFRCIDLLAAAGKVPANIADKHRKSLPASYLR